MNTTSNDVVISIWGNKIIISREIPKPIQKIISQKVRLLAKNGTNKIHRPLKGKIENIINEVKKSLYDNYHITYNKLQVDISIDDELIISPVPDHPEKIL